MYSYLHFFPQLSDLPPLKNGFYSVRAQTDNITPVDPGTSCTAVSRGVADLYVLNEDTQPVIRAIGVSHTARKDEFTTKSSISQLGCIFIFMRYTRIYRRMYARYALGLFHRESPSLFFFKALFGWGVESILFYQGQEPCGGKKSNGSPFP